MSIPSVIWSWFGGYSVTNAGSGSGTFTVTVPATLSYDTTVDAIPSMVIRLTSGVPGTGSGSGTSAGHPPDTAYSLTFTPVGSPDVIIFPVLRAEITSAGTGFTYAALIPATASSLLFLLGGTLTLTVNFTAFGFSSPDSGSLLALLFNSGITPGTALNVRSPSANLFADPSWSDFYYDSVTYLGYQYPFHFVKPEPATGFISFHAIPAQPPAFAISDTSAGTTTVLTQLIATANGSTTALLVQYAFDPHTSFVGQGVPTGDVYPPGDLSRLFYAEQMWIGLGVAGNPGDMIVPVGLTSGPRGLGKGPQFMKVPASLSSGQLRRRGRSYVQVIGRYPYAAPVYHPEKYSARRYDYQLPELAHSV